MSMKHNFSTYLSPFTWRYGSDEMRVIWSESKKRLTWRRLWVALAEVQAEFGLVSKEQVADLRAHAEQINIERAYEIEAEIQHDLMAEVKTFAEQCPLGGGIIHLGMTSMDIVDNTDALRARQSLDLALIRLTALLNTLTDLINRWADTPVMGFTHLQPAEPTTLGYRLVQYAQDLFFDWQNLSRLRDNLKGKGVKGAVGTGASFAELLGQENLPRFEARLSEILELPFFPVTTQVYPRKQDYEILSALAGMGASLYKFAFDLRLLQSPPIGELGEPFGKKQIGSSAMPFKRNPIRSEKIDSLARMLAQFPRVAWDNASHSLLERTLDDSANRRTILPEAFLIADELLIVTESIIGGLQINETSIKRNLTQYGPFAAIERVLMNLVKAGADRQEIHEQLRQHSLTAWQSIQQGDSNPLIDLISTDEIILLYFPAEELGELMDIQGYLGDAPQRARQLAERIQTTLLENTVNPPGKMVSNPSFSSLKKDLNIFPLDTFTSTALPLPGRRTGKVREIYHPSDGQLLLVTTDRLSAFDRVLGAVPYKGQVLNQLSTWWFEQTQDIIANHMLSTPDPNAMLAVEVEAFPVEVIVRGYITGVTSTALWYRYSLGEREIYGHNFPDGLHKNQSLPQAIITPTTKGGPGGYDQRLTVNEVTTQGFLDVETWGTVQKAALTLFGLGQKIAATSGLILVDTKYEFGRAPDGRIMIIDEIHTPDSSRFWIADTYKEQVAADKEPENFDKEFLRLEYAQVGYRGEGEPPEMPDDLWLRVSERYITLYEKLTGKTFEPGDYPVEPRLLENLKNL